MFSYNMEGKVVIITGSTRGIGKVTAQAYSESGALPIIVGRDKDRAQAVAKELGAPAWYAVDLRDVAAAKEMIDSVVEKFGKIDVLINNAGIPDATPIEGIDEELWDSVIDNNLKTAFFCSKFAYEHMKAAGRGRIISIASAAGRTGGIRASAAYSASKSGIIGLTMTFARRGAAFGVCANAIAPGFVEGGMTRIYTPEQRSEFTSDILMGRFGERSEIACAALFLGSDAASFITGAVLDVNGGMFMG